MGKWKKLQKSLRYKYYAEWNKYGKLLYYNGIIMWKRKQMFFRIFSSMKEVKRYET